MSVVSVVGSPDWREDAKHLRSVLPALSRAQLNEVVVEALPDLTPEARDIVVSRARTAAGEDMGDAHKFLSIPSARLVEGVALNMMLGGARPLHEWLPHQSGTVRERGVLLIAPTQAGGGKAVSLRFDECAVVVEDWLMRRAKFSERGHEVLAIKFETNSFYFVTAPDSFDQNGPSYVLKNTLSSNSHMLDIMVVTAD